MISIYFEILLLISIGVIVYMAMKNYVVVDIYYWSIVILVPVILLGYWLKTTVTSVEGARIAFAFIYLDSTVLLVIILFSILRMLQIRMPVWGKALVYIATFVHIFVIWNCIHNKLYYKSMKLIDTGVGIATKMESGPLKSVHWAFLLIVMIAIVWLLIVAWVKKGTYSRKTLILYTAVLAAGILIYIIEALIDIDFSTLPTLYVVSDVLIAFNYDRDHNHDISFLVSKEQAENSKRAYVALSLSGEFLSCNKKTYDFMPELEMQIVDEQLQKGTFANEILYDLLDAYKNGGTLTSEFQVGEMACLCEISEFSLARSGKAQGYLFDIRDITEERRVFQVMRNYNKTLNEEVSEKMENIKRIQEKVVIGLANMIDNRDSNTGGHVKRTSEVVRILVEEVQKQGIYDMDEQMAEDIIRAAPMHDLGKITIDNHILLKPGRLTDDEYEIMKTHSVKSGEFVHLILDSVEEKRFVKVAFNVARYHHERWDGGGYPEGLVGEMIPLEARIMAVADVYDALITDRCYRKAMSVPEVTRIITENMGTQFDPNMYSVFLGCKEKMEEYYAN
ncbi:HD domain-containing phosphohydrolase [Eubacterium oxidoreducens]|uniref:N-terminal 7TM region of histidine kinase n=1 Tax=Eubacterium oxidoreducens TaxID=1732 RepID=A0A1G6AF55_EUBOX|nr:HD domain-containing phosphohydrolase [Eubacterium oxidoreducens]SDB06936.1 N-terminal 7TM region of histidine kinase [Eubacterium oxidoreducens]